MALRRRAGRRAGALVNLSELASIAGVSVNTVSRYLSLMEEAHVLRLVPSFSGGKRREVSSARKVFFLDNGLRNAVLGRVSQPPEDAADRGKLLENWVFSELAKEIPWTQPIRYWRSLSGAEVDFVIDAPATRLGIEVKAAPLRRPRLARSSRSFIQAYEPAAFFVLSGSLEAEDTLGATRIEWLPLHRFPERLAAWRRSAGLER